MKLNCGRSNRERRVVFSVSEAISKTLWWILICVSLGILQTGTVSAERLNDRKICKRENLNLKSQKRCERLAKRRSRFKTRVLKILQRTNKPPVADLKLARTFSEEAIILPGRIDLDATGSSDKDGFPEFYTYQLFDDDTGQSIAGPVTTRKPLGTLTIDGELPPNLRATVIVEDDERGVDSAELIFPLGDTTTTCSNEFFGCSVTTLGTWCNPTAANKAFSTDDLLDAAQRCDVTITKSTPVLLAAAGASGGRGANVWPVNGGTYGRGGSANLGTTLSDLDTNYGAPSSTTYCYGVGAQGSHGDTDSGAGGASSLLRTCENVSQTQPTGLLLVAGGGGGGAAAGGGAGAQGGVALSTTSGPCPLSCAPFSSANGGGFQGGDNGGGGGAGGTGGAANTTEKANNGNDGISGHGGPATSWGTAGFIQGNPQVVGNSGAGGSNEGPGGGGGGGGYGGGANGGDSRGGGGGGSYAAQSTLSFTNNPEAETANGWVAFIFNFSGFSSKAAD